MSVIAAALRELMAAGLEGEALVSAVARIEEAHAAGKDATAEKRRAWDRERKRKARASGGIPVEPVESADPSPKQKGSPKPLLKTQPLSPPPSPPKGGSSPTPTDLAEQIWNLQPVRFRRSTRPDIRRALEPRLRAGAAPADIVAALRAYYAHPDRREADGRFAKAAHRLLEADRWRDFLPKPEPPQVVTPDVLEWRANHLRETGEWRAEWGPKPSNEAAA